MKRAEHASLTDQLARSAPGFALGWGSLESTSKESETRRMRV